MKSKEKAHAKFSASGSGRWLNCPGSISLSEKAPAPRSSKYAEEGTKAHECLEEIMGAFIGEGKGHMRAKKMREVGEYPREMIDHVVSAFEWIEAECEKRPTAEILCETEVRLPVDLNQFGTVDAAIVELFGRLTVIDFKYGAGIPVHPKENSQLIYYALGLAHQYDYNFEEVELVIIQPRAEVEGGSVRTHIMTLEELTLWARKFALGIDAAKKSNPIFSSGSWCRFCPAASICPEISSQAMREVKMDFDPVSGDLSILPPPTVKRPAIDIALNVAERLEMWIDAVRKRAFQELEQGEKIPGWKLVEKRSVRKWINPAYAEEQLEAALGIEAFSKPILLSPAKIQKVLVEKRGNFHAKNILARLTSNVSSGLRLVPESDGRRQVSLVERDFEKIPGAREKGANEKSQTKRIQKA